MRKILEVSLLFTVLIALLFGTQVAVYADGKVYFADTCISCNLVGGNAISVSASGVSGQVLVSNGTSWVASEVIVAGTNIDITSGVVSVTGSVASATQASTALALAATPSTCGAGEYARGVDASGSAVGCTVALAGGTVTSVSGVNTAELTWGIATSTTTPTQTITVGTIAGSKISGNISGNASSVTGMVPTANVVNLSGINTGDNAANTTYANDYRSANFVSGVDYLAPSGVGAGLTSLTGTNVTGVVANAASAATATNVAGTGITGLVPAVHGGIQVVNATGTDTITATPSPAITLTDGLQIVLRTAGANTTNTVTFNPNGLGAKPLTHHGGVPMHIGDLGRLGTPCYSRITPLELQDGN